MVYQTPKEAVDPEFTVPTVKNGGRNVKCQDSISSSGVENVIFFKGNMKGEFNRNILQKPFFESEQKLTLR